MPLIFSLKKIIRPLGSAVLGLSLLSATSSVQAQSKPLIRVLVGFPAGAGTDQLARIYANFLSNKLDANVVVENRPGAGGLLAAQALAASKDNNQTLLFGVDHQFVMLPLITKNPGFDVKKDMIPIARIANFYTCLAVPASSSAQTLQDYIDSTKKDINQGNYGVPAIGSQAHFVGYVLAGHYKTTMTPVPYRGAAPAITDLIGAQIPSAIVPCDSLVEHRKSGKIRVLAMVSEKRYSQMPDVPTFIENGVKMPTDAFQAVYASINFNPELLKKITLATEEIFSDPETTQKVAATYMEPDYASPQQLAEIVEINTKFWGQQVKKSNFQLQ